MAVVSAAIKGKEVLARKARGKEKRSEWGIWNELKEIEMKHIGRREYAVLEDQADERTGWFMIVREGRVETQMEGSRDQRP